MRNKIIVVKRENVLISYNSSKKSHQTADTVTEEWMQGCANK